MWVAPFFPLGLINVCCIHSYAVSIPVYIFYLACLYPFSDNIEIHPNPPLLKKMENDAAAALTYEYIYRYIHFGSELHFLTLSMFRIQTITATVVVAAIVVVIIVVAIIVIVIVANAPYTIHRHR